MSATVSAVSSRRHDADDLFTPEFKRLKSRCPPPDLSTVVDLEQLDVAASCGDQTISRYPVRCCDLKPVAGLRPCQEWKVCQFLDYPGLIIIQNPFIDGYQRYWVHRCLHSFPSDNDNVTNLAALGDNSRHDLWQQFVLKKCDTFDQHDPLRKLRWTTLGYHYNWTTKEYSEDNKAPFPSDVSCLAQYFAGCLGFDRYQAEAAIVNYYHLDSTLAGHTDHSEVDHSAPLFSISFGQTAIFLLGGRTKCVKPTSVFLRSGDVCVMSGECRLAYHAVPKILASTSEKPLRSSFSLSHNHQHEACGSITSKSSDCGLYGDVKNNKSERSFNVVAGATDKPSALPQSCGTDSIESIHSHIGYLQDAEEAHRATEAAHRAAEAAHSAAEETHRAAEEAHRAAEKTHRAAEEAHTAAEEAHRAAEEAHRAAEEAHRATEDPTYLVNSQDNLQCQKDTSHFKDYDDSIDKVNSEIEQVVAAVDFRPFQVYLKSSRINLNVRQVLPPGVAKLQDKGGLQNMKEPQ